MTSKETLEDLGYKLVDESYDSVLPKKIIRYEKDETIYVFFGRELPKERIKYFCKTILIFENSVLCCLGTSNKSFDKARENSLDFYGMYNATPEHLYDEEMKIILKMKERKKLI